MSIRTFTLIVFGGLLAIAVLAVVIALALAWVGREFSEQFEAMFPDDFFDEPAATVWQAPTHYEEACSACGASFSVHAVVVTAADGGDAARLRVRLTVLNIGESVEVRYREGEAIALSESQARRYVQQLKETTDSRGVESIFQAAAATRFRLSQARPEVSLPAVLRPQEAWTGWLEFVQTPVAAAMPAPYAVVVHLMAVEGSGHGDWISSSPLQPYILFGGGQ